MKVGADQDHGSALAMVPGFIRCLRYMLACISTGSAYHNTLALNTTLLFGMQRFDQQR
jgi:hypothetical protein